MARSSSGTSRRRGENLERNGDGHLEDSEIDHESHEGHESGGGRGGHDSLGFVPFVVTIPSSAESAPRAEPSVARMPIARGWAFGGGVPRGLSASQAEFVPNIIQNRTGQTRYRQLGGTRGKLHMRARVECVNRPKPGEDFRESWIIVLGRRGEQEAILPGDCLNQRILALQVLAELELLAVSYEPDLLLAARPRIEPLLQEQRIGADETETSRRTPPPMASRARIGRHGPPDPGGFRRDARPCRLYRFCRAPKTLKKMAKLFVYIRQRVAASFSAFFGRGPRRICRPDTYCM